MATGVSGYVDLTATKGFTLRVHYSESYDITSNSSSVTITKLQVAGSQYWAANYYLDGTISINGTVAVTMSSKLGYHGVYVDAKNTFYNVSGTLGSVSGIAHSSDGTKNVTISASVYGYTVDGKNGNAWNASTSKSVALTTIPRKSSLSVPPSGELGKQQTLTVTKQADAFTHTITYTCGGVSGTVCSYASSTTVYWTPSKDLAMQSPQGSSVVVNFTIATYSGSTLIGTNTAVGTYFVPSDISPYFGISSSDPTGYADYYGGYIQGQSKLKLDITATPTYGAWITEIRTIFDGRTYYGESITSDAILQTGEVTASITVMDSRNRYVEGTKTISVIPYAYPKLTSVNAFRSSSDGVSNPKGEYITVRFNSSVYSLNNKNGAWYKVRYKKSTDANYTEIALDSYTGNFAVTNGTYTFPADESSYDIVVLVGDRFKTITYAVGGASAKHTWSMLKKNGEIVGMAFGKVAEHEGVFDLGWPLKCSGGGDSVVEQGEYNGWTYRKWDSGVAECWKIHEFSTTINTAFGSLYCGNATQRQTYPFAFVEKPVENVTLQSGSTQAFLYVETGGHGVNGTNSSARYNVFRPGAMAESQTFYLSFHVIGKWK